LNTAVTEKVFDGEEVYAIFKRVGCEAMAETMNLGSLANAGFFLAR
jgi:hypothetical protein